MAEWRNVVGFEGRYIVSDDGKVISLPRTITLCTGATRPLKGRELRQECALNGYLQVALCKDGTIERKSVHRIVAEAFIPRLHGNQVNHKNGIKSDNRAENLEWCTSKENIHHSITEGLRPPKPKTAKRVLRSDGAVFESLNDAAKAISASRGSIYQQIHGKRSHVHGYQFRFEDNKED